MHATTEEVSKQLSEAGDGFKIQFPHLSESIEKLLDSRCNLELPMREAATILKIPGITKVKKTVPPRTNFTDETFYESRVLNREARNKQVGKNLAEVAAENRVTAEKKAKRDEVEQQKMQ